jgi:hypothetical protein
MKSTSTKLKTHLHILVVPERVDNLQGSMSTRQHSHHRLVSAHHGIQYFSLRHLGEHSHLRKFQRRLSGIVFLRAQLICDTLLQDSSIPAMLYHWLAYSWPGSEEKSVFKIQGKSRIQRNQRSKPALPLIELDRTVAPNTNATLSLPLDPHVKSILLQGRAESRLSSNYNHRSCTLNTKRKVGGVTKVESQVSEARPMGRGAAKNKLEKQVSPAERTRRRGRRACLPSSI